MDSDDCLLDVSDPGDTPTKYNPSDTGASACRKIPAASTIPPYRYLSTDGEGPRGSWKNQCHDVGGNEGCEKDPSATVRLISPDET